MAVTRANITPELLVWARERLFATVEAASERLKVSAKKLEEWESGEVRPTFNQARDIANRLYIPFGYLFLSNPPPETPLPLPDLRTVAGAPSAPPSPDFLEVIHDAQRKQAWYREELFGEGVADLPFVGSFSVTSAYQDIAANISNTIGADEEMRRSSSSWEEFLAEFIRRTEECGILALRSGVVGNNNYRKLEVAEFRGFALVDSRAPLIFVNGQDSKSAQIFTLAHELAHIWVNESGVSNPDFRLGSSGQINPVERLCNRIAAEILLPEEDFLRGWNDSDEIGINVNRLVRSFRVSSVAVLRQALELGRLDNDSYWEQYGLEVAKRINAASGGNFHSTVAARNSRRFVSAVITATAEGRLDQLDAARLLNVKGHTIESISEGLFGVNLRDA